MKVTLPTNLTLEDWSSQLLLDLPSPRARERQEFRINFYERTVPALPVSVG